MYIYFHMTSSCKHFTQPFHITIRHLIHITWISIVQWCHRVSHPRSYLSLTWCHSVFQLWSYSFSVMLPWYLSTMVLFFSCHVAMVSFNHGLTHLISGCHGIFQPWSYTQVAMVSFNHGLTHFISGCHGIFQPWSYTFHIREHTPANLILTVGLPVQAKSPVI